MRYLFLFLGHAFQHLAWLPTRLLLLLIHVPNLFQEWVGTGGIWRDSRGVILNKINHLGVALHPPEWLRRHSFYPLNYEEDGRL